MKLFSFGKKRPYWAQRLSAREFEDFQAAVRGYFADHSTEADFDFDEGKVEPRSGPLTDHVLGLHNLGLACRGLSASGIRTKCGDWFGQFFDILQEEAKFLNAHYDEVKDSIRVRIYPSHQFEEKWDLVEFGRVLPGGQVAMPVFDLSNSVQNIPPDRIKEFGMTLEQILKPAIAATVSEVKAKVQPEQIADGVWVFNDASCLFVSTGLLDLPAMMGETPELGFIALVPARSTLMVAPLKQGMSLAFTETLRRHARQVMVEAADGGTDAVYWVRGERIVLVEEGSGPVRQELEVLLRG